MDFDRWMTVSKTSAVLSWALSRSWPKRRLDALTEVRMYLNGILATLVLIGLIAFVMRRA